MLAGVATGATAGLFMTSDLRQEQCCLGSLRMEAVPWVDQWIMSKAA
jgi:hypothetical protein